MVAGGIEPPSTRLTVRHSTTRPLLLAGDINLFSAMQIFIFEMKNTKAYKILHLFQTSHCTHTLYLCSSDAYMWCCVAVTLSCLHQLDRIILIWNIDLLCTGSDVEWHSKHIHIRKLVKPVQAQCRPQPRLTLSLYLSANPRWLCHWWWLQQFATASIGNEVKGTIWT